MNSLTFARIVSAQLRTSFPDDSLPEFPFSSMSREDREALADWLKDVEDRIGRADEIA